MSTSEYVRVGDWRYHHNEQVTIIGLLPGNRVAYVHGHLEWYSTNEGDLTRRRTS